MNLRDAVRIAVALPVPEAAQIYLSLWETAKIHGEFKFPLRLSDAKLIRGTRNPGIRPFHVHKDRMGDVRRMLSSLGLITVQKVGGPQPAKITVNQLQDKHVAELVFALNRVLRLGLEQDLRRALVNGRKSPEWKSIENRFRGRSYSAENLTPGLTPGHDAGNGPRPASEPAVPNSDAGSDAGDVAFSSRRVVIGNEGGDLCRSGLSGSSLVGPAPEIDLDGRPAAGVVSDDHQDPGQGVANRPPMSKSKKAIQPIDLSGLQERDELVSMIQTMFGSDSLIIRPDGTILPSSDDTTPLRILALLRSGTVRKDWRWTPRDGDRIRYLRAYKSWLIVEGVRADGSAIRLLTFLAGRTRKDHSDAVDPRLIDVAIAGYVYRVALAAVVDKAYLAPAHGAWQRLWNSRAPVDMQAFYLRGVREGHVPEDPVQFLARLDPFWAGKALRALPRANVLPLLDQTNINEKALEGFMADLHARARGEM